MNTIAIIRRLIFSTLIVLLFSCNNKTTYSDFGVVIDAVVKQSDSIHTYYTTDGTIDFNENQSFWVRFNGDSKNQIIAINFPQDTIPNQLRFDFGRNKKLEEIILNKLTINYKTNHLILKGEEIYNLFRVDQSNTILNYELGVLKRKDSSQINGPSLYPNGDLLNQKLTDLIISPNN
jgi:hypothetical protein